MVLDNRTSAIVMPLSESTFVVVTGGCVTLTVHRGWIKNSVSKLPFQALSNPDSTGTKLKKKDIYMFQFKLCNSFFRRFVSAMNIFLNKRVLFLVSLPQKKLITQSWTISWNAKGNQTFACVLWIILDGNICYYLVVPETFDAVSGFQILMKP